MTDDKISRKNRQILREMNTGIDEIESQIQEINASMRVANTKDREKLGYDRRLQLE